MLTSSVVVSFSSTLLCGISQLSLSCYDKPFFEKFNEVKFLLHVMYGLQ
jgi:hypothetical protein